jgi:hypothetical protein
MNNLFQTAKDNCWTIGEFKRRIQEQSSLKSDNSEFLDRQHKRGDNFRESARLLNIQNKHTGLIQTTSIDTDSYNLTKLQGGNQKCQH